MALTVTAFQTANWTTTTTPLTISVTGALTGDKIVVIYGGDNNDALVSAATTSTTGGSTTAWTEPQEGFGAVQEPWLSSAWADVTADGTVTVSLARTQVTPPCVGRHGAAVPRSQRTRQFRSSSDLGSGDSRPHGLQRVRGRDSGD